MDVERTLNEMASCDFSTPMSVTIMYEDSEDEVETKTKNNIHECSRTKIYDDVPNVAEHYDKEGTSAASQNCETGNVGKRRKQDNNNKKILKERILKKRKKDKVADINQSNALYDAKCCTASECSTKYSSSDMPYGESEKVSEHLDNNFNKNKESTNTTKEIEELNSFVNDLLTKVSESLICIWKAYYTHINNVSNKSNDIVALQESKKLYMRVRNYFYQLSFYTASTIILSRENDNKFTEKFINNTVTIAEQKKIKLSAQEIKPFFFDMISWVKQKNELQNLPVSKPVNTTKMNVTEPLLRQQLSQPLMKPLNSCQSPSLTSRPPAYNSDPCNREIKITTLNEQNQQILLYSNVLPLSTGKEQTGSEISNSLRSQRFPVTHKNYQTVNNVVPAQSQNMVSKTNFISANYNGDYPHTAYPHTAYEKQTNVWCNPSNWSYPTYSRNYGPTRQIEQFVQQIHPQSNFETSRSSVSTDSGFISPLHIHSPVDNTIVEQTPSAQQVTPLITDVTSLSPKALPMAEGVCHVCGVRTKKRCLGCYQIYYCSYNCQQSDWGIHMNLCAQRQA